MELSPPILPPSCSCSEIDKTLESMSAYRKNKWIIEGRLRRWVLRGGEGEGDVLGGCGWCCAVGWG